MGFITINTEHGPEVIHTSQIQAPTYEPGSEPTIHFGDPRRPTVSMGLPPGMRLGGEQDAFFHNRPTRTMSMMRDDGTIAPDVPYDGNDLTVYNEGEYPAELMEPLASDAFTAEEFEANGIEIDPDTSAPLDRTERAEKLAEFDRGRAARNEAVQRVIAQKAVMEKYNPTTLEGAITLLASMRSSSKRVTLRVLNGLTEDALDELMESPEERIEGEPANTFLARANLKRVFGRVLNEAEKSHR